MSQRWAHFLYSQLNESMICRRSITTKINPDVCTLPFFLMIILHSKLLGQSKAFVGHDSSHNYNEQSSLGIERVKRREKKSQTMFKAIIGLKGFGFFFPIRLGLLPSCLRHRTVWIRLRFVKQRKEIHWTASTVLSHRERRHLFLGYVAIFMFHFHYKLTFK